MPVPSRLRCAVVFTGPPGAGRWCYRGCAWDAVEGGHSQGDRVGVEVVLDLDQSGRWVAVEASGSARRLL